MDQRRQVALTVYPGFKTWEATGPLSVLSYATQQLTDAGHADGYDVTGSGASCHVAIAHVSTGRCSEPDTALISLQRGSLKIGHPLTTKLAFPRFAPYF
nr:hypothetical protein [uncultured Celeribacter sp.]